MYKKEIEAHIDHLNDLIKSVEMTKERSKKTIEDCDKLVEDINEFIKELKKELDQ